MEFEFVPVNFSRKADIIIDERYGHREHLFLKYPELEYIFHQDRNRRTILSTMAAILDKEE